MRRTIYQFAPAKNICYFLQVVFALECLILRDSLVDENFYEWCDVWIVPLIVSLSEVPLVVAADIEKLLNGIFKRHPSAVFYVINKW